MESKESVHVGSKGLAPSANPLIADKASMYRLGNMIADNSGWISKRPGIRHLDLTGYSSVFTGANTYALVPKAMWCYDDHLFVYAEGAASSVASGIASYDLIYGQGWKKVVESTGTLVTNTNRFKMRSCQVDRRQLITTSGGVKRIASVGAQYYPTGSTTAVDYSTMYRSAGIPRALDPRCANAVVGGGIDHGLIAATNFEWLLLSSAVAYRICWIRRDENGILQYGAPSGRIVVRNTSTTTNYATRIKVVIPSGVSDTSHVMQVYRTNIVSIDGTGAIPDPGDDMYLSGEYRLETADLTNGYVLYDDISFDGLLGDALYTNEAQEGALGGRAQPPLANDIASFGRSAFFSNVTEKQRLIMKILAVDSSGIGTDRGIRVGDVIMCGDLAMVGTLLAAEPTQTYNFAVDVTTGPGSEVIRALKTTESIVHKYNLWSNAKNGRYAAYNLTTNNDIYGVIMFEEKSVGGSTACYFGTSRVDSPVQILPAPKFTAVPANTLALATSVATNVGNDTVECVTSASHGYTTGDLVFLAPWAASTESGTSSPRCANTDVPSGLYKITVTAVDKFTFPAPSGTTGNQTDARAATTGGYVHKIFDTTTSVWTEARSANPTRKNRLMWSPPDEYESAPISNYVDIGSSDRAILRIVPTITSLFVFKEDGTWRLQGDNGEWALQELDRACIVVSPESPAVVGSRIFAMTSNGVMSIDESGATDVCGQMKVELSKILRRAAEYSIEAVKMIGIGNDEDQSYTLTTSHTFSVLGSTGGYAYNVVRYHIPTRTWSFHNYNRKWESSTNSFGISAACIMRASQPAAAYWSQARLGLGFDAASSSHPHYIGVERRSGSIFDMCDLEIPVTVSSVAPTTGVVTLSATVPSGVEIGDVICYIGGSSIATGSETLNYFSTITAISGSTVTVETSGAGIEPLATWATGVTYVIFKQIPAAFSYQPDAAQFESQHVSELEIAFGSRARFSRCNITFQPDCLPDTSITSYVNGYIYAEWAAFQNFQLNVYDYREEGSIALIRTIRSGIPRQAAINGTLRITFQNNRALELFDIAGVRVVGVDSSMKSRRTNG